MTIAYCSIANQHCTLVEAHANRKDNEQHTKFASELISGLDFHTSIYKVMTSRSDGKTWGYCIDDQVAVICMTDSNFSKR